MCEPSGNLSYQRMYTRPNQSGILLRNCRVNAQGSFSNTAEALRIPQDSNIHGIEGKISLQDRIARGRREFLESSAYVPARTDTVRS